MEKTPETFEVSILDKLDQNKNELILVDQWKQKLELLVLENPFIEITDSKSYELAKQRKAIFRNARLELRNTGKTPSQESVLIGKINSIKDFIKTTIDELVIIPSTPEDLQDAEVKRWEGIKEAEKAEKERLENERIEGIKNKANELESSALEVIQKMTYTGIVADSAKVSEIMQTEFDFEEYEILYTGAFSRVQNALEEKVKDLTERENQRIAREKAEEEAAAEKAKNDLQSKRLTELLPYNGYGADVDMATLWTLTDIRYYEILEYKKSIKKSCEEAEKIIKEKEESEKKEEKEAIFSIRQDRLIDAGFEMSIAYFTIDAKKTGVTDTYSIDRIDVYESDTIGFENILNDGKKYISDFKEKEAKNKAQKEADEKASKADAAKLKKENAERAKRLKTDKEFLKSVFNFNLSESDFVLKNLETKEFFQKAQSRVDSLVSELLTELENL